MASKKLRFEVFKRDGFQCVYCGRTPPQVVLEADHIEPRSKGGKDDINNLITACFDCNRGKRNVPLNKIPPQMQETLKVMREKEEQIKEYRKYVRQINKRIENDIEKINKAYNSYYPGFALSERFIQGTIKRFIKSLPLHLLLEAMHLACTRPGMDQDRALSYFCGICWNWIKNPETLENHLKGKNTSANANG